MKVTNTWQIRNGKLAPLDGPEFIPEEGEYNLLELLAEVGFNSDIRLIPGRGALNDTTILEGRHELPEGFMYVMLLSPMNEVVFLVFLRDFGEYIEALNQFHNLFRLNMLDQMMAESCGGPDDDDDDDDDWYPHGIEPSEN
jgi:hypothetical protein